MKKKNLKIVLIFLAAIFMSFTFQTVLFAQDFGVKGGFVFSTINGQGGSSIKPGLQVGAYQKFGPQESPYIQIELLLTQKGSWNWDQENRRNINLYYIDLPILFGIEITNQVTFNLGFQPSMLLGGAFRFSEDGQNQKIGLGGIAPRFDYSTLFGLEYDWNDQITFGLRYNHSFVPLQSHENIFADNRSLPLSKVLQVYGRFKLKEDFFKSLSNKE